MILLFQLGELDLVNFEKKSLNPKSYNNIHNNKTKMISFSQKSLSML